MKTLTSFELNVMRRVSVGDLLVRTAARYPNKLMLRYKDKRFTYRQFNEEVNRCAHSLMSLGICKGDRAAILSHNCYQYVIYWWALLKIGAIITPLNFMLKGEEIKYIINHAEAKIFLIEDALVANVLPVKNELTSVKTYACINLTVGSIPDGWMNAEDLWASDLPTTEPEVEIEGHDPASLLYTSGTEAAPKGVLTSHTNFYMAIMSSLHDLRLEHEDVMITGIPLYHVAAMYLFIACTALGTTNHMEYAPDPMEILKFTAEEKVTYWIWPPTLYLYLPEMPGFDTYDLSSLRRCIIFGALAAPALLERWRKILPNAKFMNYYGQTEMSPMGASLQDQDMQQRPDSIGQSHLPMELKVFGFDDKEVPRGEVGELVARGPAIMMGYYKEEEKTARTFRGGWHHTGDMVRMDEEGFIFFTDRAKDIIKTGGENVSSQEVEAALFKHPKVADVAVIGLTDPRWSEIVTAIIVPRPGQETTEKDIFEFCKKEMAGYKVPKRIIFTNALPRNPSGKILKKELRKTYEQAA